MSVTVRAPAKINLSLLVGTATAGGFHTLATIYQAIGLWEQVTVVEQQHWSIHLRGPHAGDDIPVDETNLAWCAGVALQRHHGVTGTAARIEIHKGVPVAGGMAGGSADAAATLVALDRLWDLGTPDADLLRIAARLGSDVPFALVGGTAAGTGRGELVSPLEDRGTWWWVAVPSDQGLSTPAVYREFDVVAAEANAAPELWSPAYPEDPDVSAEVVRALTTGDPRTLGACLRNDLEEPALRLRPDLNRTFTVAREVGAVRAMLSGSGPTVLLLADDAAHAQAMHISLSLRGVPSYVAPGPVAGAHVVDGPVV